MLYLEQQRLCDVCQSKDVCVYLEAFHDFEKVVDNFLSETFTPKDKAVNLSSIFNADLQCTFFIKIESPLKPSVFELYLKGG